MPFVWTVYDSGAEALVAGAEDAAAIAAEIARRALACEASLALVFTSDPQVEPGALARALDTAAPDLRVVGCSTAGELTPDGIVDGALLALLLPRSRFTTSVLTVEGLAASEMTGVVDAVSRLRERHRAASPAGGGPTFALCLIDGMSYSEERVTSAIFWGLDDIPLIGGSAGDRLAFSETLVIANGTARTDRAVVVLVSTDVPFRIFKSDNFVPMETKFVVTASDSDRRIVMELNARPAALEYADAVGRDISELNQTGFASHPVIVRVGGEQFCRAIRGFDEDGALLFACAIDDGVVLTLAEARGMVESTRATFRDIEADLAGIDFVLGFDCAYRRVDAENRQVIRKMSDLYRSYNVIGFGTYGEQFQSMHLNQTLTGVAFGRAVSRGRLAQAAE